MRFSSDDSMPMQRGSSLLELGSECSDASPPASMTTPWSMGSFCKQEIDEQPVETGD